MREVECRGASAVSRETRIVADDRDENGGSHHYSIQSSKDLSFDCYIQFQKGSVREAGVNGISDEALLSIVLDRLQGFQEGPSRSRFNSLAITNIEQGLLWLNERTHERQRRGVEGTSQV